MKTGTTGTIGLRIEVKKEFHNVEFVVMKENQKQNQIIFSAALLPGHVRESRQMAVATVSRWYIV